MCASAAAQGQRKRSFTVVIFLNEAHDADWVMGQCACHVLVVGAPSFTGPRPGITSDVIDKMMYLVFLM
jgi:hypothetical protein